MTRLAFFRYTILCAIIFLGSSLWWYQIHQGEYYYEKSENNRIRLVSITAPRGRLLDRNGKVLVGNRAAFELSIIPEELRDYPQAIDLLVTLLNDNSITQTSVENKIYEGRKAPFVPVSLVRPIDFETLARIEEHHIDLPGVMVTSYAVRDYRWGDLAGHLLGYVGPISASEYDRLKDQDYRKWDRIGKTGIEKTYEKELAGKRGWKHVEITASGRHVQTLKTENPFAGRDIYLSIDIDIQQIAQEAFNEARGACIVLDADDGDILAMVSAPSFDPNAFGGHRDSSKIRAYFLDPDYPIINRCIQSAYSPGSVFKIVLALAGFDTARLVEEGTYFCNGRFPVGGREFRCLGHHGDVAILEAIERSCNIFFYNLGLKLGPNTIAEYSKKLGLGEKTGIDLPFEKKGIVPSPDWKKRNVRRDGRWYDGETAVFSIGQGYLQVTPLQLLIAMNTVVNGGRMILPQLATQVHTEKGLRSLKKQPGFVDLDFHQYHLRVIKEGMYQVVHGSYGTGKRARLPGYDIGGKTGTVQIKQNGKSVPDHGWFFGFSPVDRPEYSIIVFVENRGSGGGVPARIAKSIFQKIWEKHQYETALTEQS